MTKLLAVLALLLVATQTALAGDLTLIGQATTEGALDRLIPQFEKAHGDKVNAALGNPGVTLDRLHKSSNVDVVIVSTALMDTMAKEGVVDDTTRVVLGKSLLGMGIAAKAKKPVFRDAKSFTAFVRKVKTIGLVDPKGGSGTSPPFIKAMEDMGLASELTPKYRFFPGAGAAVADAIARGEVEAGVTAVPELVPNKGVKVIGPIPSDVLVWSGVTYAAIGSHAQNPVEARKFVAFLTSHQASKAFRAIGLSTAK